MSQVSIADCNILKYSLLWQCVRSCACTHLQFTICFVYKCMHPFPLYLGHEYIAHTLYITISLFMRYKLK